MLKEAHFTFTKEELCHAAHGNLVAVILVTQQYLQAQNLDGADF